MSKLNKDYVVCAICGAKKKELGFHIKKLHNISSDEYKKQFDSPLICEESSNKKSLSITKNWDKKLQEGYTVSSATRKKCSEASKRNHKKRKEENYDLYMEKQQALAEKARRAKGTSYKHSEETKQKMRGPRPCMRGIKKSDQTRKKLSEAAKKRKPRPHTEETKQKIKDSWVRRKSNKKEYAKYLNALSKATKENSDFIEGLRRRNHERIIKKQQKSSNTSIEIKTKEFLEKKELEYKHQYILTDKCEWLYDFYIPSLNLLLEIDGEYWHSKSKEQINKDKLKTRAAKNQGYNFLRLSDKDLNFQLIFETIEIQQIHNQKIIANREKLFT